MPRARSYRVAAAGLQPFPGRPSVPSPPPGRLAVMAVLRGYDSGDLAAMYRRIDGARLP